VAAAVGKVQGCTTVAIKMPTAAVDLVPAREAGASAGHARMGVVRAGFRQWG
jgi:hypothetical protein